MLSTSEQIAFLGALAVSLYLSWRSFSTMYKVIIRGTGTFHFDNLPSRILEALSVFISQKTVLKTRPFVSFLHAWVAWAFILYFLVNLGDVLWAYIENFHFMGQGVIGNYYRLFVDVFSVLAMIGVLFFLVRRFIYGSKKLKIRENVKLMNRAKQGIPRDSLIVGLFILFHVGFRFLGESFAIALEGADSYQPLATLTAGLWSGIDSVATLTVLRHLTWWLALGLILAFIPYFPSSKHAHLFMGPINYLTRPHRNAYGTLEVLDFENDEVEQFGVSKLEDLEKTGIVDAYACIMCNRCQDVCPAYVTGKELSPSALEINKRYYVNENKKGLAIGEESQHSFLDFALSESALWACTSCAACVEVCPVGNEPMFDILNVRRDRVLMESQFPKELQGAFNGMERNQNPWNMNEDRLAWAKQDNSIAVKTVDENPDFEILYWVGCAGAFDQKGQKIAQAFTKILNKANVNFAVLGNKERCTGDSARRAGNEYLFTMMADANVEILNSAKVKKIVTTCPHCLHTLKNEYPQFGGHYEVEHHTQFIENLIKTGKLSLNSNHVKKITYHDPCYLGRHNKEYDAPRTDLQKAGYTLIEMERHGKNSFCCGAGGAQMWKEEEPGTERIRQNRLREAKDTGADVVCTSCPFCLTMLRDASNELEADIKVSDLAEIIADRL
ncbi:MAG TPA: (Fe-S)-binding protein [Calditrichaeota bacterium]|nr:(Fe-S)-binding protein [Calditrichota bacterium]